MNYADMPTGTRDALVAEKIMGWKWIPHDFYDVTTVAHPVWLLADVADVTFIAPGEWTYRDEDASGNPTSNRLLIHDYIPRYHEDMAAAWAIIRHIAALPDMPFAEVQKKRHFMRMLGMQPCNDLAFGALTLKQLAALTPKMICTAALYVFGREQREEEIEHGTYSLLSP